MASALLTGLATFLMFFFSGFFAHGHATRGHVALIALIAAWPVTFVATFINVALAAAADARLDGRRLSAGQALRVPAGRIGQILLWSLLAAGVGALLSQIAERVPFGGRLASWVLGGAWALLTFFAIPVLAIEGCTAAGCVKRSGSLIKERWGEGVAGSVGINAIFTVASIVPAIGIGVGAGLLEVSPAAGVPVLVVSILAIVVLMGMGMAVRNVFSVALYRYAVDGEPKGGFAEPDLQHPFSKKRG